MNKYKMTFDEAVDILRKYNEWRRGAETEQENPIAIGIAIDLVLNYIDEMRSK